MKEQAAIEQSENNSYEERLNIAKSLRNEILAGPDRLEKYELIVAFDKELRDYLFTDNPIAH